MRIENVKGIFGMDVNVCAKGLHKSKCNQEDAKAAWNTIAIWAHEAANHYRAIGAYALADDAENASNQIYDYLHKLGYFDD